MQRSRARPRGHIHRRRFKCYLWCDIGLHPAASQAVYERLMVEFYPLTALWYSADCFTLGLGVMLADTIKYKMCHFASKSAIHIEAEA